MEHPLHPLVRYRNEYLALAGALLHAEANLESHVAVLREALPSLRAERRLLALARRSVRWTAIRPQPRLKFLLRLLHEDKLFREVVDRHPLRLPLLQLAPRMRALEGAPGLPVIETVRGLADWLQLDPEHLLWFADLRDWNGAAERSPLRHYHVRLLPKSSGGVRVVESPKARLRALQRQILRDLLEGVPLHSAVHGFRKGRSIVSFAAPHAGQHAVLRLDLGDFFPSITGPRVQALFRALGYPEAVADLLGGLCTTTTPKGLWHDAALAIGPEQKSALRALYARPHLPQGAPSSPALANLCAFRLDRRLAGLARAAGAAYTRYADDLAFSGDANFARGAERFASHAAAIASEEGFAVRHRKTRWMELGVRQHLAGLTVNAKVNVSRKERERLKATLTNCVRLGPETQNREGHPDFRRHLEGRVAFVSMVDPSKGERLRSLLKKITW